MEDEVVELDITPEGEGEGEEGGEGDGVGEGDGEEEGEGVGVVPERCFKGEGGLSIESDEELLALRTAPSVASIEAF